MEKKKSRAKRSTGGSGAASASAKGGSAGARRSTARADVKGGARGGAKRGAARADARRGAARAKRDGRDARRGNADAHRNRADAGAKRGCPLCPVFGVCGGCETLDVPYAEQLARKQRFVEELLADLVGGSGGTSGPPSGVFRAIIGMDEPFHYRNKVISPYAPGRKLPPVSKGAEGGRDPGDARDARRVRGKGGRDRSGKRTEQRREVLTGMYARGTHRLVPVETCALENETAKAVTLAVRDLMRRWNIAPYNEDVGTGFMRHAVVRVGHESGEVLVTLVTNEDEFPASRSFCRELVKKVPAITSVVQNVNTRQTNVILGQQERTLYGPGFILDTLCGLSFRISSRSFYQVNSVQTEVLYEQAIALAGLTGSETVIDAYCGTGTIGLTAARRGAGRVIGVDNVESAIRDARDNARHNGIENAAFEAADASAFMRDLAARRGRAGAALEGGASCDADGRAGARDLVLLMDPPRAGSTEEFLGAAVRLAPSRIVYISCNPTTQARDAAFLVRAGYRIDAVQPVDMFPHTEHVECICRFVRA